MTLASHPVLLFSPSAASLSPLHICKYIGKRIYTQCLKTTPHPQANKCAFCKQMCKVRIILHWTQPSWQHAPHPKTINSKWPVTQTSSWPTVHATQLISKSDKGFPSCEGPKMGSSIDYNSYPYRQHYRAACDGTSSHLPF